MDACTTENILSNYASLAHSNRMRRKTANQFFLQIVHSPLLWNVSQDLIHSGIPQQKMLGVQLLYRKTQNNITQLSEEQTKELNNYVHDMMVKLVKFPGMIRSFAKISALLLCWLTFLGSQIFQILRTQAVNSQQHFKYCLLILQSMPEQLVYHLNIDHKDKRKIQKYLKSQNEQLLLFFINGFEKTQLIQLTLDTIEQWTALQFQVLKNQLLVRKIVQILVKNIDIHLPVCCRILSRSLKYLSVQSYMQLQNNSNSYSFQKQNFQKEIPSLQLIVQLLMSLKKLLFFNTKQNCQESLDNNYQNYETVMSLGQLLVNLVQTCSFLLFQSYGKQLEEMVLQLYTIKDTDLSIIILVLWNKIVKASQNQKLKSYDQYFRDLIFRLLPNLMQSFQRQSIQQLQINISADLSITDGQLSIQDYRKESIPLIQDIYQYLSRKKGVSSFFTEIANYIEQAGIENNRLLTIQTSIFVVDSVVERITTAQSQQQLSYFLCFIIEQQYISRFPFMEQKSFLLLLQKSTKYVNFSYEFFQRCLLTCLKSMEREQLCQYAAKSYQNILLSKKHSVSSTFLETVVNFYFFATQKDQKLSKSVLKILLGTLALDRQTSIQFFNRIAINLCQRCMQIKQSTLIDDSAVFCIVEQCKTLLDFVVPSILPLFMETVKQIITCNINMLLFKLKLLLQSETSRQRGYFILIKDIIESASSLSCYSQVIEILSQAQNTLFAQNILQIIAEKYQVLHSSESRKGIQYDKKSDI